MPAAHRIRELAVWLGGTLLPDVDAAAISVLRAAGASTNTEQAVKVHYLTAQLTWGTVSAAEFWHSLGAALSPPLSPESLAAHLLAAAAPRPEIADLLRTLSRSLRVRFVSDYPRDWLEPVAAQARLDDVLHAAQVTYTTSLNADNFTWCDALLAAGILTPGATLWVDRNTQRALAVLRRGVDAALCEDAGRLSRDLRLWSLLPP